MIPRENPYRVELEKLIDPVHAFALSHYLDANGIRVHLSDPPLRCALGEIPYLEAPLTLFLDDPDQMQAARRLIRRFREGPGPVRGVIWRCAQCGEEHEPEFGSCWNCDTPRP